MVKCIVGNKVDKDLSRVVTTEEGQRYADLWDAIFVETSAKQGLGVQGAFDELVNRIISTPSLWQNSASGTRPGDRLPGGDSSIGNIAAVTDSARNGCASC